MASWNMPERVAEGATVQSIADVMKTLSEPQGAQRWTGLPQRDSANERPNLPMRDRIGLGGALADRTFDNFRPEDQPAKDRPTIIAALNAAKSFLENPRTLVFSGGNGVGKTHLAAAVGNAIIAKHGMYPVRVYFISFQDALRQLKKTYQQGYEGVGEEWYLDRWRKVPVLILDEVGQAGLEEKPSEFTRRIGYDIIDGRYRAGNKPIILTTNKEPSELRLWITDSGVSRLFEMGEFLQMTGQDWRVTHGR